MKIYNSLTKKIVDFEPINPPQVTFYSCGPTVYDYNHIGHMRKYVGDDILIRTLRYFDYHPKTVMNITDVGHLVSDADEGQDKMEKGAKKHGLSVWQVAEKFTKQFFASTKALNIEMPHTIAKATDHIKEQVELIKELESKGYTYQIDDGVYFDTSKFGDYGQLSSLDSAGMKEGARVKSNLQKRNSTDFALWKFNTTGKKREMEWQSPWGVGFPGWHIECSAMSMKYLGHQFDFHTGGVDHKEIHHPNEIAQSEAATGVSPFVKYWVHHEFLMVDSHKMSKSLGNLFTVQDIIDRGIEPLALRYLFLTTHYRKQLNFTWDALESAQQSLSKMRQALVRAGDSTDNNQLKPKSYEEKFEKSLADDLNLPEALATTWEVVKSGLPAAIKKQLITKFDTVLGLSLVDSSQLPIPSEVHQLFENRNLLRKEGKFKEADKARLEIEKAGFLIEDNSKGSRLIKK